VEALAEVGIRSVSDQGAKQETKTDSAGKFSVPNLPPALHRIHYFPAAE